MRKTFSLLIVLLFVSMISFSQSPDKDGWIKLFDGKSFDGWKVGKNAESFKIENGMIVVNGETAHLFYTGPVANHDFKNFELRVMIMTTPGSNSGVYFHTAYQEDGWPEKGFEVQVNNSHTDWRRSGSIYAIQDVKEVYVKDNEWYEMIVNVEGKKVTVKLNGKVINEYTEPDNYVPTKGNEKRIFSSGTFALQGHDPKSKVFYKDVSVRIKK